MGDVRIRLTRKNADKMISAHVMRITVPQGLEHLRVMRSFYE